MLAARGAARTANTLGMRTGFLRSRLGSLPGETPLSRPSTGALVRAASVRAGRMVPTKSHSSKPKDLSLPNSSWGSEMMRLYGRYNSQCEAATEGGGKRGGLWRRLPSYSRFFQCAPADSASCGGNSNQILLKARLFTRSISEPGAAFEYVMFVNSEEQKCVAIFQCGHLLEGPPGHAHGGAIATMVDAVTGAHANQISEGSMTANLNINYHSPIPLGSTVLLESSLDKKEGRKTFLSCKVTSSDGSKVYTDTTALFLSIYTS